jgi:hypothetical protein
MAEMANQLGFEVTCFKDPKQQKEDDETVTTVDILLMKSIASGEKSLSAIHQSSKSPSDPSEPGIQAAALNASTLSAPQVHTDSRMLLNLETGNIEYEFKSDKDEDGNSGSESDKDEENELVVLDNDLNQIDSTLLPLKKLLSMPLSPSSFVGGISGFAATRPCTTKRHPGFEVRNHALMVPPSGIGTNMGSFDCKWETKYKGCHS